MVLGLFDNIPSTTPRRTTRTALGEASLNVAQTPSRRNLISDGDLLATGRKLSRTPQSTGKRFMLDTFATPVKRKLNDENTPSSTKRVRTPAFLRRSSQALDAVAEDDEVSVAQPWQRRSFGRSLSSMIQDMRRQEDEEHDEEMDILREIEAEEADKPYTAGPPNAKETSAVLPDLEQLFEDDFGEIADGRAEQSKEELRRWKKKGLKRQTKRVILRPVQPRAKPKDQHGQQPLDEEDNAVEDGNGDIDEDANSSDQDFEDDGDETAKKKVFRDDKKSDAESKMNKRKINPNAVSHANFRSLKIKNKNSKAKGRGRRR